VFSIGFLEMMMVAVVGLLVMGPERLPGAVREATVWIGRIKRHVGELQHEFESQVEDMDNDAMLASMREGRRLLDEAQRDINAAVAPSVPPASSSLGKPATHLPEPGDKA